MKRATGSVLVLLIVAVLTMGESCDNAQSTSGVNQTTVKVPTGADGLTTEQRNVGDRLKTDNKVGSIKHLYVISAYSGQVLIYSTVRGKVTSSGKRLSPSSAYSGSAAFKVNLPGGNYFYTQEVLEDDGTYGPSVPYLYWWDTKGVYHQHYIEGGQILHISDQPLAVKGIVINMEISQKSE